MRAPSARLCWPRASSDYASLSGRPAPVGACHLRCGRYLCVVLQLGGVVEREEDPGQVVRLELAHLGVPGEEVSEEREKLPGVHIRPCSLNLAKVSCHPPLFVSFEL